MATLDERHADILARFEQLLAEVRELSEAIKAAKPRAFSADEVAELVGLNASTVRNMVHDGRLKRIPNTGHRICIAATEVEAVFGVFDTTDDTLRAALRAAS